jgi:hypothetical protein
LLLLLLLLLLSPHLSVCVGVPALAGLWWLL